jgi:hypothetical protein
VKVEIKTKGVTGKRPRVATLLLSKKTQFTGFGPSTGQGEASTSLTLREFMQPVLAKALFAGAGVQVFAKASHACQLGRAVFCSKARRSS